MEIFDALGQGLDIILEPHRLLMLWGGVLAGLALGILPGIGGVAGTALLLPFTFSMDAAAAMAMLLGLAATTTHGDPISAIVLGAPGHAASAATALDGYPMTKRGEGARALGAAYMSALMGGLFGAVLMAAVLPIVRPAILFIGSPELLALAVFGISMVAVLSGNTPLRGLTMACFGVMLAMIGSDPQTGTLRWTLDSLYLWEGMPLVPLTLGVFALPELCDLMVARAAVYQSEEVQDNWRGLWQGSVDCFVHWWLVMRCSWIGSVIGAIPGISAAVIDWISYGHALKTEKGAAQTFGKGDVRGVIAAESATCSREGGALVPTIVFGVPGSAGMAILLGAFMMHGLVPGPEMLTKNLAITYSMVWSIAIANVVGSGLCYVFSSQFAKLATLRYTLILPVVLSLVYIGAYEGHRSWGDLYSLLIFGVFAWAMKHFKWPRPPLVLGFILGGILERYMFISIQRYGVTWMTRPLVLILFGMALLSIVRPFLQDVKKQGGWKGMLSDLPAPRFNVMQLFPAFMLVVFAIMMAEAYTWNFSAKIIPMIVGVGALFFCGLSLANDLFKGHTHEAREAERIAAGEAEDKIHMDIGSNITHLPAKTIFFRGMVFFGYLVGFLVLMALIGLIPTVPIFVVTFMRVEGREPWKIVIPMTLCITGLVYGLFDQLLSIPWPGSLLGEWFPLLKEYIPSM
ncbi:MAG: TctA family transporter [Hyphomicrobiales bacterium]|nr:TctA family transporter [Hyphomicrobiales bacterium]